MRLNLASVLTGFGFVFLLVIGELTYLTVRMTMKNMALGGGLAAALIHPRNFALSAAAFALGVLIANRLWR